MSWLNLNQSFSNIKGQITNFASEVLSEGNDENTRDSVCRTEPALKELEAKCRDQELTIASLKKLTEELEASLQAEKLSRKNGVKEEESNWYWDPPSQTSKTLDSEIENRYKVQIRALQDEISNLKERDTIDLRPDTEEELNRLRVENKNLTSNLEDLDNQHQMAMEKLLSLKKELQKNFEVLKQEHEDLKTSNEEYSDEMKTLLNKIGERDKEIESLKNVESDYDTLYHKYQNLERIHGFLRENTEKFQEENQDLNEEVFKLQEKVTKLEHDLEIATKHSVLPETVSRQSYDELLKELNDIKARRNTNQIHLDEINIDDNAKSVIENLKRDIQDLKHQISQKDIEANKMDSKLLKPDKIMNLYNKYVNFELPVDYVGEIPSGGDNIIMFKLESVFKTVNSFKKEIDVLEQKLSEKDLNINHLHTQIDDLTTENDFLNTDMQHYESELNEMKKNNDFLISEIAALKNTSKLEPIIETHEDNLAKLETELADCNRINKNFESEIKRIEQELAKVQTEKIVLQESLTDLRDKYKIMLNELEVCKNQTTQVVELENSTSTQQSEKLNKAKDEIDDLKKRLNMANAKNEQLSIDVHIIENDKVLLSKQIDDLKHTLEEKLSAYKDLEDLKIALENKLQDSENKLNEVIKHKEDAESDKIKLEEKFIALENELLLYHNNTNNVNNLTKLNEITKENTTLSDTIENLKAEIENLKQKESLLLRENDSLKNESQSDLETFEELQQTIDDLKTKIIHTEVLNNELLLLKDENQKLIENKTLLETELSSTDSKILHLEEEFEKLISDINEKDILIDSLNSTISNNNITLSSLKQNITDHENSVIVKNEEISALRNKLDEISENFNNTNQLSIHSQEELSRLHLEKEELEKQIFACNDEINSKNNLISNTTNRLEEFEKTCVEYKITVQNKDKEIKELNQSIVELTDKLKVGENITPHNNDSQEKETIEKTIFGLESHVAAKDASLNELKIKFDQLENTCLEYKTMIENMNAEKNELINLVNMKHNESLQYHNEIQRLNYVLQQQTNELKKNIEEKDMQLRNLSEKCLQCENLRITLKEKDEIIVVLNQNVSDYEKVKSDLASVNETVKILTEKCEVLDKSLVAQCDMVKNLTAQNAQLSEQEQNYTRELERLRAHLVEMEENYTQELMTSEMKLTECQTRLHQVEERAKQTSTVYTSNSIRANQEVETLRNQIKLLEKQREEVQTRLSDAEDAKSRSEAALTNLQVVLEQFQLDKERDIQTATEKIRNKMNDLKHQNQGLHDEIARLNSKLEESLAGLQAATRLGDQVETKAAQINDLKEQVRTLQTSVAAAEERYHNAISNQQDKIDKNLIKNLVINYVTSASQNVTNKIQVLRILSTVLDFNQQECEKLGLVRNTTAPDSLATEFVKFLQNESRPRAPLPNMMGITQSRSATPSRKSSTTGPSPTAEIGHKRNPSTGSNNLLFQNIDKIETASQISRDSDREPRVVTNVLDTGVNQTRNTEGAILKSVLRDM